jgi:hypothetical protein
MICAQLLVNLVTIISCMFIALPVIDAEAARIETKRLDSLQEGAIGIAGMDPEFDNHARPDCGDQPECEWHMSQPCGWLYQPLGILQFEAACRSSHRRIIVIVTRKRHHGGPGWLDVAVEKQRMYHRGTRTSSRPPIRRHCLLRYDRCASWEISSRWYRRTSRAPTCHDLVTAVLAPSSGSRSSGSGRYSPAFAHRSGLVNHQDLDCRTSLSCR